MSTVYTSFITANGRIRAEANASPLASQLYLPDALGTVTQTVDTTTSSNLIYRARHRAYGDRAVAVATSVPPQNQFVGSLGVRRTGRSHAQADMRARVHSLTEGRFITQAPLWAFLGRENRYGYANQNPASYVDPTGNQGVMASPWPIIVGSGTTGAARGAIGSRWRTRFSAIWLGKEIVIC